MAAQARKAAHPSLPRTCFMQIDIGRPSRAFPVTPPYVRVRIRRFGRLSKWSLYTRKAPTLPGFQSRSSPRMVRLPLRSLLGLHPMGCGVGQHQLDFRPQSIHETHVILSLPFNPFRGPFRPSAEPVPGRAIPGRFSPFGRVSRSSGPTSSCVLCRLLTPRPRSGVSRPPQSHWDTYEVSRGKFDRLPRTTAGFTLCTFDGYGLCGGGPARPALTPRIRFLFIGSRVCSTLPSDPTSR